MLEHCWRLPARFVSAVAVLAIGHAALAAEFENYEAVQAELGKIAAGSAARIEAIARTSQDVFLWANAIAELLRDDTLLKKTAALAKRRARDFDTPNVIHQWLKLCS